MHEKREKKFEIPRVGCRINLDRSNRHTEKQRASRKLVSGEHCCSCCSPTAVFFVFSIAIARLNFKQSCNCFSALPMRNKYSELVSEQMKLSVDGQQQILACFFSFFRNFGVLLVFEHVSVVHDDDFGLFQGVSFYWHFVKVKISRTECDMLD